jgi:hypothetical protein
MHQIICMYLTRGQPVGMGIEIEPGLVAEIFTKMSFYERF